MSTLTVQNIQGSSSSGNEIQIASGHKITGATGSIVAPGHVIQVKSGSYNETLSLSVDTRTDIPNLSLDITPSSTSSKILVSSSICYGCTAANLYASAFFMRDSTDIGIGTGATGNRLNISFPMDMSGYSTETYKLRTASLTFLDSPSTTSTITYKVQVRHAVNGTMYINRSGQDSNADYGTRGISTFTIMEIAG